MANDDAILKAADRPEYLFSVGERSRLGCIGRRPADRTVCSARAPNTAREARALRTLNPCAAEGAAAPLSPALSPVVARGEQEVNCSLLPIACSGAVRGI